MVRRNILALLCASLMAVSAFAQQGDDNVVAEKTPTKEIIKTGLNYGPLPAVAFDAESTKVWRMARLFTSVRLTSILQASAK